MGATFRTVRWWTAPVLTLVIVLLSDTGASAARLLPLPSITAESGETIRNGDKFLQVRSMVVARLRGVRGHPKRVLVSCGSCPRVAEPKERKTYPTATRVHYTNLNWLLRAGDGVRVTVVRRGYVGRYVRLVVRRRGTLLRLSFRASGCLGRGLRVVRCPRGTSKVPMGQPVPRAPAPPPGQTTEPVTPILPVPPPPPSPSPAPGTPRVCSDGIDNDGDGLVDYPQDPGCRSANDFAEKHPACSDGLDNDGDGLVDFPDDTGCMSDAGTAEQPPACSDGLDNDGDGKIDYPTDVQCTSAADRAESS